MHEDEITESNVTKADVLEAYAEAIAEIYQMIDDAPNDLCRQYAIAARSYIHQVRALLDYCDEVKVSTVFGDEARGIEGTALVTTVRFLDKQIGEMLYKYETYDI